MEVVVSFSNNSGSEAMSLLLTVPNDDLEYCHGSVSFV